MKKTTKRFEVTAAQIAALSAAETALAEIVQAFHAANADHFDFDIRLTAHGGSDYSILSERRWVTKFEWSCGDIIDGGRGATFERALEAMHQRTDAQLKRMQAERYINEAKRLRKEAAELEGKETLKAAE